MTFDRVTPSGSTLIRPFARSGPPTLRAAQLRVGSTSAERTGNFRPL